MFYNNLKVQLNSDEKKWTLLEDLVYEDSEFGFIGVPENFITDFASIPRIPIVYDILGNRAMKAATIHDWLYQYGTLDRKSCDQILHRACLETNIDKFSSWVIYVGVRCFGWIFFRKQ